MACAEVDSHEISWLFLIFNLLSRRDFAYIGNMHVVRLLDYAYSQNMHMWDLHDYAYFQNMHILVWVDYAYHLNVHICVHMHTVFAIDVLINTSSSTTSTGVYSTTFVHVQHESPFLTTRRISTSEIFACPQRNFTLRGTWYKYSELGIKVQLLAKKRILTICALYTHYSELRAWSFGHVQLCQSVLLLWIMPQHYEQWNEDLFWFSLTLARAAEEYLGIETSKCVRAKTWRERKMLCFVCEQRTSRCSLEGGIRRFQFMKLVDSKHIGAFHPFLINESAALV